LRGKKCIKIEKKKQIFLVEMKVRKKKKTRRKGLENVRRKKKRQFETHT
jgi:hypothetical protein